MRLLLMDTCGLCGSVALAEGGRVTGSVVLPGRSASERLLPEIRELMCRRGWTVEGLGAIGVVHGPGSFTGVRIGLAAALGLSEACAAPLVTVSRLAVLAGLGLGDAARGAAGVHAVLDAGRGQYYWGRYGSAEASGVEGLLSSQELMAAATGGKVVVCEPAVAEALRDLTPIVVAEPEADDVLQLAMDKIARSEFADRASIEVNYLRRTSAEIFAKAGAAGS